MIKNLAIGLTIGILATGVGLKLNAQAKQAEAVRQEAIRLEQVRQEQIRLRKAELAKIDTSENLAYIENIDSLYNIATEGQPMYLYGSDENKKFFAKIESTKVACSVGRQDSSCQAAISRLKEDGSKHKEAMKRIYNKPKTVNYGSYSSYGSLPTVTSEQAITAEAIILRSGSIINQLEAKYYHDYAEEIKNMNYDLLNKCEVGDLEYPCKKQIKTYHKQLNKLMVRFQREAF